MKLGIIADVHEDTENLTAALATFEQVGVDQIVMLGDVLSMGKRISQACELLANKKVVGVWGNHEFGFCGDLEAAVWPGVDASHNRDGDILNEIDRFDHTSEHEKFLSLVRTRHSNLPP